MFALLVGCTYTRPLDLSAPADRQRVTERAAQQVPTLVLSSRLSTLAPRLSVRADSTTWVDPVTGTPMSVASSEVKAVRFSTAHPRPAGAFLKGLIGGAVIGTAVGYLVYDGPGWFVSNRGESMAVGGTAFALLGGGTGAVISLDRLSPEVYVRLDSTSRDIR